MIALPGVTIQSQICKSLASLVYQGVNAQGDGTLPSAHAHECALTQLKQDLPVAQKLAYGGS
jgi:hypothetical protein